MGRRATEAAREQAMKKQATRRRRKKKGRGLLAFIIILLFCGVVLFTLANTVLFPIKNIKVSGASIYTEAEIRTASMIAADGKLFAQNFAVIEKNVTRGLPYIESVKVSLKLPDTICLTVTAAEEVYAYFVKDKYYITNAAGKVLRISPEMPAGLVKIKGAAENSVQPGEKLSMTDPSKREMINTVGKAFSDSDRKLTGVDVSNLLDIYLTVDDRITVKMGSQADIEYKCAHLMKMLDSIPESDQGTIDLSLWTKEKPNGYFKKASS